LIGALASLAVTLVAVGEAPPSQADGLGLQLTWESPQGCPDLASERAEIRRRAGETGQALLGEPITAQGAIRLDPSGSYSLLLRTRVGDTEGERVLAGHDCRELADAAALVLALLINPEAALSSAPESGPPTPAPPPPPNPPLPGHAHSGLGLGLGAVLASGVLPDTAAGLIARLLYRRGILAVALEIAGFFPSEKIAPVLPRASASFYRLESALQLCAATPSDRRLGAALCLGGAVVSLHGQSVGVSAPGQVTAYWPEGLLAVSGQLRLAATTQLRLAADLHGLGSRPDFAILGLGNVYRPAGRSLRGILGLDVLF
jgi:hypothetical protein